MAKRDNPIIKTFIPNNNYELGEDIVDQPKKSGDSLEVWIMCFRAVYITIIYSYLHGNE